MPVRITMAPVRAAMPPSSAATSMLMAVVTDLGRRVAYCSRVKPSARARARVTMPTTASWHTPRPRGSTRGSRTAFSVISRSTA